MQIIAMHVLNALGISGMLQWAEVSVIKYPAQIFGPSLLWHLHESRMGLVYSGGRECLWNRSRSSLVLLSTFHSLHFSAN